MEIFQAKSERQHSFLFVPNLVTYEWGKVARKKQTSVCYESIYGLCDYSGSSWFLKRNERKI